MKKDRKIHRNRTGYIISLLLVLCMALTAPITAFAANPTVKLPAVTTVTGEEELTEVLKNTNCPEIKLGKNIEISEYIKVNRTVTLDLNGKTLTCNSTDHTDMIWVNRYGSLTIKDSGTGGIIDGQNKNCGISITGGVLTMESGIIANCLEKITDNGTHGDGAAVDVGKSNIDGQPKYGTFIMNGGIIKDCTAEDDGGAVDLGKDCTFIMNGGTIKNCTAEDCGGAVIVKDKATFEMNNGLIEGCSVKTVNGNGGGVYIEKAGRFIMNGGIMKDCKRFFSVMYGYIGNGVGGEDMPKAEVVLNGGIFENCGTYGCTISTFTVTFNSDGGTTVTEQNVRNAPAVKPADPTKSGYNFAGWYLGEEKYTFDTNVTKDITLKARWTSSSAEDAITTAAVENVKLDYQPGNAPQATATVAIVDQDKYEIEYECWQQFENNNPVAAWYSDNGSHGSLPTISTFESGKSYVYSVMLKPKDGYSFSSEVTMTVNGQIATSILSNDHLYAPAVETIIPSKPSSSITTAAVENVKFDYEHGNAPQTTATVATADQDKYEIKYECWQKRDKLDEDTTGTVAYWYSDENYYQNDDVRLTSFDKEGEYQYSVRLNAKDGFTFSNSISAEDITLNGKSLPEGSYVLVLDEGKTCLVTYGMTVRTVRPVEEIRFNGPTTDAISGNKPSFTGGSNSAYYDVEYQKWEDKDNRRIGVNSDESKNESYDQVITSFEYGKTYIYGVSFNIADLGLELGYRFDENTRLYINDKEISLGSDQVQVSDGGMSIQFNDVLSMTPEAPWQKIDVVEIEGATITFKDGDKPVFTGKTPENAPYIYQFECWETKDGAGVNSAEFFDNAYEKHITAFKSGETYQYILYLKAEHGYYFTADTKIKINGTLYGYRLVNIDPGSDSTGEMYTFWAYTDLTMTPTASETPSDYKIIDGANGKWTQNSNDTLTFRANGSIDKFTGVKVDNTLIDAKNYSAVSGSTVISLKADYLNTLSVGTHTLTVVYTDGECSTNFEIKVQQDSNKPSEPSNTDNNNKPSEPSNTDDNNKPQQNNTKPTDTNNTSQTGTDNSPKTGDNNNFVLWLALIFISGGIFAGSKFYSQKRRNER